MQSKAARPSEACKLKQTQVQVLRTKRLVIGPYGLALRSTFLAWMQHAAIESFLSRSFPDLPKGELLFDRLIRRGSAALPEARVWAVTDAADGELVAHVECKATPKTSGAERELIYAVRRDFEGRGIATEAVMAIVSDLIATGVDLVAYVNPANKASRRVLAKAGFDLTGEAVQGQGERWVLARRASMQSPSPPRPT
ncbi:GNAT family N-acetyltransferase [Variovorax robiniae]|uniref:GNAT family N-acetyltransferase n=1 Tax=Variovorax robiniae TaxID=1836199 RepID=A0ABU8X912_9BURK